MAGTVMNTQVTKPTGRSNAKNEKFANDGSYESVRLLLHKIAGKCYRRVVAMGGLGMTIDDVIQEMNLSYVKALQTFDPERGVLFSTFLQTACFRNFNMAIERAERDRRELGMVPMSDMRRVGHGDEDSDSDMLDRYDSDYTLQDMIVPTVCADGIDTGTNGLLAGASLAIQAAPLTADPAEILDARQQAVEGLRRLTPAARRVVSGLMKAMDDSMRHPDEKTPTIRSVMESLGMKPAEMTRVRVELNEAFLK